MNKEVKVPVSRFKLSIPEEVEGAVCSEVLPEEAEEYVSMSAEIIKFCVDNRGIGLAAPQIGILKRFFVWKFKEGLFQIAFNPIFFRSGSKTTNTIESCLTYGLDAKYFMTRYKTVRAVYETYHPEEKKLIKISRNMRWEEAIVWQHECDHLDGYTIATKGKILNEGD